jgi:predicted transposase YdaD
LAEGEARGEAKGKAIGEVQGKEKKAIEIAQNMLRNGFSVEQTAQLSGLDTAKVRELAVF